MRQSSKTCYTASDPVPEFNAKGILRGVALLAALTILVILTGFPVAADAADKSPPHPSQSRQQIQITADQLITHPDQNYAEFLGNVEALQGNFEMRSDRLRIFYREGAGITGRAATGEEALEKVVATGNVRIRSGNQRAETETAEYAVASGMLILTGANTILTDGNNSIRGPQISLNRLTGEIRVEGGGNSRVKAIVYSARGINPPSGSEVNENQGQNAAD